MVKRVDVLTGGASSVYGADAVAGVVNFVLDTDFEGVRGWHPVRRLPAQQRQRSGRSRSTRTPASSTRPAAPVMARLEREHRGRRQVRRRQGPRFGLYRLPQRRAASEVRARLLQLLTRPRLGRSGVRRLVHVPAGSLPLIRPGLGFDGDFVLDLTGRRRQHLPGAHAVRSSTTAPSTTCSVPTGSGSAGGFANYDRQ